MTVALAVSFRIEPFTVLKVLGTPTRAIGHRGIGMDEGNLC
jgi:hypothetical protein